MIHASGSGSETTSDAPIQWADSVHIDTHAGRTLRDTLRSGAGLREADGEEENPIYPFVLAHGLNNRVIEYIAGQAIDTIHPVHLAQELHLHHPFPSKGSVQVSTEIAGTRATPAGTRVATRSLILGDDGVRIAESVTNALLPGVTTPSAYGDLPMPRPPFPSGRKTPASRHVATPGWISRYARASGDHNPIHTNPLKARESGFEAPIAHGMGVLGILCEKAAEAYLGGEVSAIRSVGVRFSSPIPVNFPFEFSVSLDTDSGLIHFDCSTEKGTAMKNGYIAFFPDRSVPR